MKQFNGFVLVLVTFLLALSIESCTKKTLMTGEDGFKYYKVTRNHRIGVKDLDGNVIVPIKMREISYSCRFNKQQDKERWFWCCCYDNDYKEIYNANTSQCIIGENLRFKVIMKTFREDNRLPSSTYFTVGYEGGDIEGLYNYWGEEIIPLSYRSIYLLKNPGTNRISENFDKSDLFLCKKNQRCSVMDANGRCIVSENFGYENVSKSSIPAPSPLLCCYKDRGKYDYRFSSSGELFLSGDIVVKTIDRRKELYYYELAVEKKWSCVL